MKTFCTPQPIFNRLHNCFHDIMSFSNCYPGLDISWWSASVYFQFTALKVQCFLSVLFCHCMFENADLHHFASEKFWTSKGYLLCFGLEFGFSSPCFSCCCTHSWEIKLSEKKEFVWLLNKINAKLCLGFRNFIQFPSCLPLDSYQAILTSVWLQYLLPECSWEAKFQTFTKATEDIQTRNIWQCIFKVISINQE